jgi:hypothetical protein
MMPICSIQLINKAVIVTELSLFEKLETKTFIEAVGASIAGKWIDQYGSHKRVGKTTGKG